MKKWEDSTLSFLDENPEILETMIDPIQVWKKEKRKNQYKLVLLDMGSGSLLTFGVDILSLNVIAGSNFLRKNGVFSGKNGYKCTSPAALLALLTRGQAVVVKV